MKEKKTAVITFRTEEWVKELLEEVANQNRWTIAQTVNEICKYFVINPNPDEITIETRKLLETLQGISNSFPVSATRLFIEMTPNEEENKFNKTLNFEVLEYGRLGSCMDFDEINEITEEELDMMEEEYDKTPGSILMDQIMGNSME